MPLPWMRKVIPSTLPSSLTLTILTLPGISSLTALMVIVAFGVFLLHSRDRTVRTLQYSVLFPSRSRSRKPFPCRMWPFRSECPTEHPVHFVSVRRRSVRSDRSCRYPFASEHCIPYRQALWRWGCRAFCRGCPRQVQLLSLMFSKNTQPLIIWCLQQLHSLWSAVSRYSAESNA